MIEADRELLARAATINRHLGAVVSDMITRQLDGELPADRLRHLGQALARLGHDMMTRSAEISGHSIDPPHRLIIDADD